MFSVRSAYHLEMEGSKGIGSGSSSDGDGGMMGKSF